MMLFCKAWATILLELLVDPQTHARVPQVMREKIWMWVLLGVRRFVEAYRYQEDIGVTKELREVLLHEALHGTRKTLSVVGG